MWMTRSHCGVSILVGCVLYTLGPEARSPSGTRACLCMSTVLAAPARETSSATPAAAALRIKFSLESPLASGQIRRLLPGEVLTSGDRLAAQIEVSSPAYVYLVRRGSPNQPPSVLYPSNGGHERLHPELPLRIPSGTNWFQLGASKGSIYVTVIASQEPLSLQVIQVAEEKSAPLTKKLAGKTPNQGSGKPQDPKDSPVKRDKPCEPKGQDDCKRGPDDIFEADADSHGLAVLRFPLRQK